jgi:hypothetical protein
MKLTSLSPFAALVAFVAVLPIAESRQDPAYGSAVSEYLYQDGVGEQAPYGRPDGYGGSSGYFDDRIGGGLESQGPAGYRGRPPRGDYPEYGMPWDEGPAVFPHYRLEGEDIGARPRPSGHRPPAVGYQQHAPAYRFRGEEELGPAGVPWRGGYHFRPLSEQELERGGFAGGWRSVAPGPVGVVERPPPGLPANEAFGYEPESWFRRYYGDRP